MIKLYTKSLFVLFITTLCINQANAQFVLQDDLTVGQLVDQFFNSGDFVEITNITFNGLPGNQITPQVGLFSNGMNEGFSMESGLVMSTSDNNYILNTGDGVMVNSQGFEDLDMQAIANTDAINDCAIIEFDVLVSADALAFTYVFGSSEYTSYTCSLFNDAFGLFVSGPGISGSYENDAINIATIPNSTVPVAINTLNSGLSSNPGNEAYCEAANPNWLEDSQYFVSNSSQTVDFSPNGYTVNLEAFVLVEYGQTYHIKFAICDVLDGGLNSGVFLEASSFEGRLLSSTDGDEVREANLYPNPTSDNLEIEMGSEQIAVGNASFQILDIHGRVVEEHSMQAANYIQLDTSNLDRGMYILNQYQDGQLVTRNKFVKE